MTVTALPRPPEVRAIPTGNRVTVTVAGTPVADLDAHAHKQLLFDLLDCRPTGGTGSDAQIYTFPTRTR